MYEKAKRGIKTIAVRKLVLCVINVKAMSFQSFPISSQFPKPHEKNGRKFFDQAVDAMHRLPNTSPDTEAVVHRYSRKQLF